MSTLLTPNTYSHAWDEMYKGIDEQGPYYEVAYYFDQWTDSDSICNQLLGVQKRVGTATVPTVPHQHPLSPNLYCRSARVEGMGPPILDPTNGFPSYAGGFKVHCVYRAWTSMYQSTDDPNGDQQIDPTTPLLWCTQELDFDTEVFTRSTHSYKFQTTGKRAGVPVAVSLGITTMRLTFQQLPYLPMGVARSLRGRINSKTFLGAAKGLVRFKGANTVRELGTDGAIKQKVQLTFVERDVDWNKVLQKDKIAWDFLVDDTGAMPYTYADLNQLVNL